MRAGCDKTSGLVCLSDRWLGLYTLVILMISEHMLISVPERALSDFVKFSLCFVMQLHGSLHIFLLNSSLVVIIQCCWLWSCSVVSDVAPTLWKCRGINE